MYCIFHPFPPLVVVFVPNGKYVYLPIDGPHTDDCCLYCVIKGTALTAQLTSTDVLNHRQPKRTMCWFGFQRSFGRNILSRIVSVLSDAK